MMQFLVLSLAFMYTTYAQMTGLPTCVSITVRATCETSGYCTWNSGTSGCVDAECHKIAEVSVCRTGSAGANIDFTSRCKVNTAYDQNYQNFCIYNSQAANSNGFLSSFRWTNITNTPTTTLSNIPATTLASTVQPQKYTYQLFTLDILRASGAELTVIMDAYLHGRNQIQSEVVQPKFIEKAVFESLQAIRDDISLANTAARLPIYTKVWTLIDDLYVRYSIYKSQLVQSYNLVNFGASHFNRLSLDMPGPSNNIKVTWTTYTENGYMQIVSFAPEQFGITGTRSDIIFITPKKLSDHSNMSVSFTLTFSWTSAQTDTTLRIYTFDKATNTATDTGTTVSCAAKVCVATGSFATMGTGYFFSAAVIPVCGSFSGVAMLCRLNACGSCP